MVEKEKNKKKKKPKQTYAEKKKKTMDLQRAKTAMGQEIGNIPKVFHEARREACRLDFRMFCVDYFPEIFCLPFSPDHLKVISKIEESVLKGGLFAMALPRGFGKSSLVEIGGIWALVYGHRKFICMIGADAPHAGNMLTSIKSEFEHNDELLKDFPECCFPIRGLDGNSKRTIGQICQGLRTEIKWTLKTIVLPTVKDSIASGSIIQTAGITGGIRGMKHKLTDGKVIRPDFVIIDDAQSDESAESPSQVETRLNVVSKTILYLPAPGVEIAGFMPCTVIAPDDMADQILNRKNFPAWQGFRTKMLSEFPKNMETWEEYNTIREEALRREQGPGASIKFYQENRAEMDDGAIVSWPENFNEKTEISGLQHAMNLFFRDEDAFFSEAQNSPRRKDISDIQLMTKEQIANKLSKYDRNLVPEGCEKITAFIDVQQKVLFYVVIAWEPNATGYIIDYGTFPDQGKDHFTKQNIKKTYLANPIGGGFEAKLYAAVQGLSESLCRKIYHNDTTEEMKIDFLMIDAQWHQSTKTINEFIRTSDFSRQMRPSHGKFFGASTLPMSEYKRKKGDRIGNNWRMPTPQTRGVIRYVIYDTNYWKMWMHERFQTPVGGAGCLSIFGKKPEKHKLFSEHITAEYTILTEGRGRKVTEFKEFPAKLDNDYLDCVTGACVAASIVGVKLKGLDNMTPKQSKQKRKMSEILAAKKKKRGY